MGGTRSNIQIKSLTVGPRESEDGDFRSNIEADLQQVADSATDIHAAITRQLKFAGGILIQRGTRWPAYLSLVAGSGANSHCAAFRQPSMGRIITKR